MALVAVALLAGCGGGCGADRTVGDDPSPVRCTIEVRAWRDIDVRGCRWLAAGVDLVSGCPGLEVGDDGQLVGLAPALGCRARAEPLEGDVEEVLLDVEIVGLDLHGDATRVETSEGPGLVLRDRNDWALLLGSSIEVPGGFANAGLSWDAQREEFLAANYDTGHVHRLDRDGFARGVIETEIGPETLQGVELDPTDRTLWLTDHHGQRLVHAADDGVTMASYDLGFRPNCLAYDQNADGLWIVETSSSKIHLYDRTNGERLRTLTTRPAFVDGVFVESAERLWVTYDADDRGVARIDATTGWLQADFPLPGHHPEGIVAVDGGLWFNSDSEHHRGTPHGNRLHRMAFDGTALAWRPMPAGRWSLAGTLELTEAAPQPRTIIWLGDRGSGHGVRLGVESLPAPALFIGHDDGTEETIARAPSAIVPGDVRAFSLVYDGASTLSLEVDGVLVAALDVSLSSVDVAEARVGTRPGLEEEGDAFLGRVTLLSLRGESGPRRLRATGR